MAQNPFRVAIVDDDVAVCRGLARLLRAASFHPMTFGSATEFLASLDAAVPDCLVVDLQMPEMTGLELQRHLTKVGVRIPTVIITAHDGLGSRERCQAAGAAGYLLKPLQDGPLISAINAAMGRANPT